MGERRGRGMTVTVSRAILTTVAVLLFVAPFGSMTAIDAAAAAVMLYPFAHLFCKYVVRD